MAETAKNTWGYEQLISTRLIDDARIELVLGSEQKGSTTSKVRVMVRVRVRVRVSARVRVRVRVRVRAN